MTLWVYTEPLPEDQLDLQGLVDLLGLADQLQQDPSHLEVLEDLMDRVHHVDQVLRKHRDALLAHARLSDQQRRYDRFDPLDLQNPVVHEGLLDLLVPEVHEDQEDPEYPASLSRDAEPS